MFISNGYCVVNIKDLFQKIITKFYYSIPVNSGGYLPSQLIFGSKFKDLIILCDYCRYYKCDWIKATSQKHPDICLKPKSFVIADEYIAKQEFERRVEIAKKIGTYLPEKKKWQFSIQVAGTLSGDELTAIINEINSWSEKNDFRLTEMIKYKERKWF